MKSSFRHPLGRSHQARDRRQAKPSPGPFSRQQPAVFRAVALLAMTGLGWSIFNSLEMSLLPQAGNSGAGSTASTAVWHDESILTGSAPRELAGLGLLQPLASQPPQAVSFQPVAKASDVVSHSGNRIRLNGQTLTGFWQQRNGRVGLSSATLTNLIGAELLSTTEATQQPLRWFPATQDEVMSLPAWWDATDRYVDVTDLAVAAGWTVQPAGAMLQVTIPQSRVSGIRQGKQTWGDRVVVDLSGPATWQLESTDIFTITVAGAISPEMVRAFRAAPGNLITQLHVAPLNGQTVLKIKTKDAASPQIWTTGNPARLVIDIRKDAMVERDIAWAPGLRWRQQYIAVGAHRFPVYMFVVRPDPNSLALRPIRPNPNTAVGIEPILTTAQRQRVIGAVNAGFFNRNNQLPLGAVRSGGQWISGPILGRGAMAWNERGDLMMDRLVLSEVVSTEAGRSFPVLAVNSGYVQAGIGRYTAGWGATYTPIVDNEIVVTVRNDGVASRQSLGKAGSGSVPIPSDGYLLTFRSNSGAAGSFAPGNRVSLSSQSQPAAFEQYPNIVGGGPLLIRDRNIVLNPQLEGFSTNFIQGSAPRTAVGKTADGTWLIATMHDRVGGRGPTLSETAKIMQQLGAVDALNLDGGSSSSLYLSGQLLNRPPRTAARVNNGIGLFLLGQE